MTKVKTLSPPMCCQAKIEIFRTDNTGRTWCYTTGWSNNGCGDLQTSQRSLLNNNSLNLVFVCYGFPLDFRTIRGPTMPAASMDNPLKTESSGIYPKLFRPSFGSE